MLAGDMTVSCTYEKKKKNNNNNMGNWGKMSLSRN